MPTWWLLIWLLRIRGAAFVADGQARLASQQIAVFDDSFGLTGKADALTAIIFYPSV